MCTICQNGGARFTPDLSLSTDLAVSLVEGIRMSTTLLIICGALCLSAAYNVGRLVEARSWSGWVSELIKKNNEFKTKLKRNEP
ncbi:hypothetical protein LCGC14_1464230 [marine sediment metagenome]|uniref:Uncharacterized protein n=1 Tax=marine sediment metagenome TaxID=412755 RepID=A0A0F9JE79_9ZZZZ